MISESAYESIRKELEELKAEAMRLIDKKGISYVDFALALTNGTFVKIRITGMRTTIIDGIFVEEISADEYLDISE